MRFLVDITHPGHVHLFKYPIQQWMKDGHDCIVTARDKDVTRYLLNYYQIPHVIVGTIRKGLTGHAVELLERDCLMFKLACRFKPHVILGTSVNAAHVAYLSGARSAFVGEDDLVATPMYRWLAYPWATAIVAPDCLAHENLGIKHLTYPSYQKLFYLHPNRFSVEHGVTSEIGLRQDEPYAIVRLSALTAHHDKNAKGLTGDLLQRILDIISKNMRVFITNERGISQEHSHYRLPVPPERMHHVLGCAELLVSDSQTMTAEAALLGTPAIRINSFVGKISYLADLEKCGLAFGYQPNQAEDILAKVMAIVTMPNRKSSFCIKRDELLLKKKDPVPWFVKTIELLGTGMPISELRRQTVCCGAIA